MNKELREQFWTSSIVPPNQQGASDKEKLIDAFFETYSEDCIKMLLDATALIRRDGVEYFTEDELREKYGKDNFEETLEEAKKARFVRPFIDGCDEPHYRCAIFPEMCSYFFRMQPDDPCINLPSRKAWMEHFWRDISYGTGGMYMEKPNYARAFRIWPDKVNHHYVALDEDVEDQRTVITNMDLIEKIKKQEDVYAIAPCYCRIARNTFTGKECDNFAGCLYFNEFAKYLISVGEAKPMTQQEVIDYVIDAGKRGLVHLSMNSEDYLCVVCSCCECCCVSMRSYRRGEYQTTMPSPYTAVLDYDKCTGCGLCEGKACPTGAINNLDGALTIEYARCIGCGVCQIRCPQDAIELVLRGDYQNYRSRFSHYLHTMPSDLMD